MEFALQIENAFRRVFILVRNCGGGDVPVLYYFAPHLAKVPPAVWGLLIITGFFGSMYDIGLINAYRLSDISQTVSDDAVIGYGKPLPAPAILGMIIIAVGCLLIPLQSALLF
jgi:hypothetical protein